MLPGVDVSEQGWRRDPLPAWGPGAVSGTVSVGCCEAPAEWAGPERRAGREGPGPRADRGGLRGPLDMPLPSPGDLGESCGVGWWARGQACPRRGGAAGE